jgi:hypothetical protein
VISEAPSNRNGAGAYWFLSQPTTGRLWRIQTHDGRVWIMDWQQPLVWLVWVEISRDRFARQAKEHEVIDLHSCPEVSL